MIHFMDLPKEYRTDKSKFSVLPICYEKDLTFGKGTANGPIEILNASKHLEYFDEQFNCEPFEHGIKTLEPLKIKDLDPESAMNKIKDSIPNNFFVALGGDHATTIGTLMGLEELQKNKSNFDVIVLDAHPDFFDSWNGSKFNHRCTSKYASQNHNVLILGARSMDIDEANLINKSENVKMIKSYDLNLESFKKELLNLKKKVYISIDVDVFDPSFIRNTGTPEPGGFLWDKVINILKLIFDEKEVIASDIVEFAPVENSTAESYALAKLTHKLFALKAKQL